MGRAVEICHPSFRELVLFSKNAFGRCGSHLKGMNGHPACQAGGGGGTFSDIRPRLGRQGSGSGMKGAVFTGAGAKWE